MLSCIVYISSIISLFSNVSGISERALSKLSDRDKDSAVGTSIVTGSKKGYTHSLVSGIILYYKGSHILGVVILILTL